jgi:multidrug resistance efflux pump
VPFAALPYAGKVSGFLEELQVPAPPMQLVNAGRLLAYIDQSWDHSRTMKAKLAKNVAPMQKRAQETHRILVELLTRKEKLTIASAKAA